MSRNLEGRSDKRPLPSDLRESGSIEQDADLIVFLYRENFYNQAADPNLAELIVAKQRDGATGTVYARFTPECTRFSDWQGPLPQNAGQRPVAGFGGGRGGGNPF